jgi:hypothetical protein
MENETLQLDTVKELEIMKDVAQALAYLHAQVRAAVGLDSLTLHCHRCLNDSHSSQNRGTVVEDVQVPRMVGEGWIARVDL